MTLMLICIRKFCQVELKTLKPLRLPDSNICFTMIVKIEGIELHCILGGDEFIIDSHI